MRCCGAAAWPSSLVVQRYREGASLGLSLVAVGFLGALVALSALQIPHMTIFVDLLPAFVLGCIVFAPNSPLGRLLESAPLRFIGRLSYSLYAKMVQADPFRMSARAAFGFRRIQMFRAADQAGRAAHGVRRRCSEGDCKPSRYRQSGVLGF